MIFKDVGSRLENMFLFRTKWVPATHCVTPSQENINKSEGICCSLVL